MVVKEAKRYGVGLALLALPLGMFVVQGASNVDRTFETVSDPLISVSNLQGNVVIRAWDKPEVHALCTTASARVEIDTEAMPSSGPAAKIHFTTHLLDSQASEKGEQADYTLDVPAGATLRIHNPEGSVTVTGPQGDTWVDSVGGKISVSDSSGHLAVRSIGGDIEVLRPSGRVEASSVTGNMDFKGSSSSKLRAVTNGSGSISFEGDFAPAGEYILSSYRGDLSILCPASDSFELSARTVRGKVDNQFHLIPKQHPALPSSLGRSLVGTYNNGAATVQLTSFSGTIRVRPLR